MLFPIQGAGVFVPGILTDQKRTFSARGSSTVTGIIPIEQMASAQIGEEVLNSTALSMDTSSNAVAPSKLSTTFSATIPIESAHAISIDNSIEETGQHSIDTGAALESESLNSAEIANGDSFLILADILSAYVASVTTGGYTGSRGLDAQLLVNGVEVKITDFQYSEPTGRLGALLNVTLAIPDTSLVPMGASITFNILVHITGGVATIPIITNGKLSGRDSVIAFTGGAGLSSAPDDSVTFGTLDVISDKFTLAPRRPVVMYDPFKVAYEEVETNPRDALIDEQGRTILPVLEHIRGLTAHQVLRRAYTGVGGFGLMTSMSPSFIAGLSEDLRNMINTILTDQKGLDFTSFVTNIPDYPVSRADFTVESGWHQGAQPVVGMYGPLYLPLGTRLLILYTDAPLPFGTVPHNI